MEADALRARHRSPAPAGLAAILAAVVGLGGCATARTSPPATQVTVPGTWDASQGTSNQAATGDLSAWWQRLGDPILSNLIERAQAASPDIRSARARLRESRARRDLAAANRMPSVSAPGSARGSRNGSPAATTGSFSAGFDASWEPDIFGATGSALRAAEADLLATTADLHGTHVSLAAEVALSYVELRSYQARLDIARRNLASQAETLQLTEWRLQAGLVSEVDAAQARTNHEQTRAQLPALETSVAEAGHRLAILLGLAPGALSETLAAPAPVPVAPTEIAIGIPADTLRQRPDVRAAELRLLAENARLAQAQAGRYPSASLTGSIGLDAVTGAISGGTSLAASLAASVVQKIFDAGRIRRQIEIQDAAQEQALVSYEAAILTALEDVENALVSLAKTREREEALASAAASAQNAVSMARNRYSAGLADFQTVLDTERTALSIEDSLASTHGQATTAVITLYKALGGGWSPDRAVATASDAGRVQS